MFRTIASLVVLLSLARLAPAEMIYDVTGVAAPSFVNDVSASYVGQFVFPDDTVGHIDGWVEFTNEPDLQRTISLDMTLNLPGSVFQPWDTRLYAGVSTVPWSEDVQPMTMLLVDYGVGPGSSLSALDLEGGGGWDGWAPSFVDYPVSSLTGMSLHQVNEPAGIVLWLIGVVAIVGVGRELNR